MGGQAGTGELTLALLREARRELSDMANTTSLFRKAVLRGPAPLTFKQKLSPLQTGNPEKGQALLEGRFTLGGETVTLTTGDSLWDRPAPSRRFAADLHSFVWLPDLMSLQTPESLIFAKLLLDDWVEHFGQWNWFSWSPKIAAPRIKTWLMAGPDLFDDEEMVSRSMRYESLARQVRRLSRSTSIMDNTCDRLQAAISLALAAVCLELEPAILKKANSLLAPALKSQILPDGGHVSRSPETSASLLTDLVMLEVAALERGVALDEEVRRTLDRLAPFVQFCCDPDGALPAFHGGGEGNAEAIASAVKASGSSSKRFNMAPHSGFHKAEAGNVCIMMDGGGPPPGIHAHQAHASALAFTLSVPGGRLIVNCGWSEGQPASWREPVKASAAHSVLTLDETSSSRFLKPGWRRDLLGTRIEHSCDPVRARRNEEDSGIWLEASHDGYRHDYGLSLRRRLYLASDGGDLRGEDSLYRPVEDGPPDNPEERIAFTIRFHLHPDVKASLSRDSMSALLVLSGGEGWRFRTDGGTVRLERSVYLAAGAPPRRSTQMVISGEAEPFGGGDRPPNRVRWAFQRLGRIGTAG